MYLNFRAINSESREAPLLRLRTMGGKELGSIPFVTDLKFELNYSDLSTIEFSVPYMVNHILNPFYDALSGYKVVYTDEFGVYVIMLPEKRGDGTQEIKTVKGYSLEYTFQKKDLYLQEGTYNFWNPMFPGETILGRIIELDRNWSVGYVAPRLIGCYRTFDEYNDSALGFLYGDAMERYHCAIVFDVYNKTINAYDAGDDTGSLPIYLDYHNLVKEIKVEEILDDMATKLHVFGGGDLSIRPVNPIGTDYLVDLSYFLNNGDLDIIPDGSTEKLSDKVRRWRSDIAEIQPYYTGLVSLRSSATSRKLAANAQLNELNGELQTLTAQQSVYIQEHALERTEAGKAAKQLQLNGIASQIASKNNDIKAKQDEITNIQTEIDGYDEKIKSVAFPLSISGGTLKNGTVISGYFTGNEQNALTPYLIEGELTEETFITTDVGDTKSSALSTVTDTIAISSGSVARVSLTEFSRTMYTLTGGNISIPNSRLSAEIMRGTLDVKSGNSYTLTAYLGKLSYSGHDFSSGMITVTGTLSGLSTDVSAVTENSITQYLGTRLSFRTTGASSYFTVAASDFQEYSVALELYKFGTEALSDYAWPVYEFSIDTANFLYQEQFEPFKNSLELGKGIHLHLGSEGLIHPKIIGVELDFEDITRFSLIFSNRYQRKNELEYLQDELRGAGKSSKRFDASKYLYDRTADKMTGVTEYMNGMLDAAVQTIKAAKDQSVIIDGAGIHVSTTDTTNGNDKIQLRIVNGMIAMTNDNWQHAKLAIGRFYSPSQNMDVWGVNADLIAGTLIIGSNLYIETQGGYFTVDDEGVRINSMNFRIDNKATLRETLDGIDGELQELSSSLSITAAQIRAELANTTAGLSSTLTQTASQIRAELTNTAAGLNSSLTITAEQIRSEVNNTALGLTSSITQTASEIRAEVSNTAAGLSSSLTMTAEQIRAEVRDSNAGLVSTISQTASEIRAEVSNETAGLSSSLSITAEQIRAEVRDTAAGLNSSITQTASQIRLEVNNTAAGLSSSITQTASEIRAEVNNTAAGLSSSLSITAEQIRSEVSNTAAGLNSSITQTASEIRAEVNNTAAGLNSSLSITASEIRAEVNNTAAGLSSSFSVTASQIRSEVRDINASLSSSITQTASEIRAEVSNATAGLSSTITQTASQIRAEVSNSVSGLNSSLTITASQIRSEVNDVNNRLSSSITQTASEIRSEVSDATSGLSSQVTQTADKISWLVKSGTNSSNFTITDRMISLISNQIDIKARTINIDASQVNMTGAIVWSDLSQGAKNQIDANISTAIGRLSIPTIPSYITSTKITATTIESPTIFGGELYAVGYSKSGYYTKVTADGLEVRYRSGGYSDAGVFKIGKHTTGDPMLSSFTDNLRLSAMNIAMSGNVAFATGKTVNFNGANVIGLDINTTATFG